MALVGWFYFWTASSSGNPFVWRGTKTDYYNLLKDGFAHGKLSLPVAPDPALLASPDPYDPELNHKYEMHDASFYGGKYYLYFGPTPVVTLFLPWWAATGNDLPDNFAAALFAVAGFLASCGLLFTVLGAFGLGVPLALEPLLILALGLCQFVPFALRRPLFYEIAICSGFFFLTTGILLVVRHVTSASRSTATLVLAGLCLGLSAGCRPHFAVAAIAVLVLFALHSKKWRWQALLPLAIPVALCGAAIAWYNWARFGNPLESGRSYQLTGANFQANWRHIFPGIYYFLISPPSFVSTFPYIVLRPLRWGRFGYYLESVGGLFGANPVYLLGVAAPLFWRRMNLIMKTALRLVWVPAALILAAILPMGWALGRYVVDFAPLFLVVSLVVAAWLIARARGWMGSIALAACCVYGIAAGAGISITGPYATMLAGNPDGYHRLAAFFSFGRRTPEGRRVRSLRYECAVTFPRAPDDPVEPVLTTGRKGAENAINIEYLGGARVRFQFQASRQNNIEGPELTVTHGQEQRLVIRYDGLERRLQVKLDNVDALDTRAWWFPTSRGEIHVGDRFSGKLRVLAGAADLSRECLLVPENLSTGPWDRGVARESYNASFVYYGNKAVEDLWMGSLVRFAGSGVRSVSGAVQTGPFVTVSVLGPPLDAARDGYPNAVTCVE
jgi:hypothetical protein